MFYKYSLQLLEERGVRIRDIAEIVYDLQSPHHPSMEMKECLESVEAVLRKREVQHALITGISIDVLAEKRRLSGPFQTIMDSDDPLYGIDEILALSITNVYGSIGLTSFGYLDRQKTGIIKALDDHPDRIHVFLDDIVAGLAAAASARIAHNRPNRERYRSVLGKMGAVDESADGGNGDSEEGG
ncbi:phosphatidylglycerophosphatase A family protein [Pasteuria penetrans]|uniref:phosphatidylglycerophosphatase A family protein n=1 Tax=Pasteuria penetrans TaxID=86005 RepID=UPI000FA13B91|nr:phosphatidylglycerophosphatase A [Pasteuria penetrans]